MPMTITAPRASFSSYSHCCAEIPSISVSTLMTPWVGSYIHSQTMDIATMDVTYGIYMIPLKNFVPHSAALLSASASRSPSTMVKNTVNTTYISVFFTEIQNKLSDIIVT